MRAPTACRGIERCCGGARLGGLVGRGTDWGRGEDGTSSFQRQGGHTRIDWGWMEGGECCEMYVCIYINLCMNMCIYVYIYIYVHVYTYVYIYTSLSLYVYISIYIHICTCTYTLICIYYACMYRYLFICIGVPEIQNGHALFILQTSSLSHVAICIPIDSYEYVHIYEYDVNV